MPFIATRAASSPNLSLHGKGARCSHFVRLCSRSAGCARYSSVLPSLQPFPMEGQRRAQAWRYQPQFRRPRHFHDQPELNVVTRGVGRFAVGNAEMHVHAGQVIGFVPGCEHELIAASDDFELFALGFEPDLVGAYQRECGKVLAFGGGPMDIGEKDLALIRELCISIDGVRDRLALEQTLLSVAAKVCRRDPETLGWRALEALASDPARSRDALTRKLASNRGDVSRAFRRDVGATLPQYRNRLRILAFIRKLDAGLSMAAASRLAGFGSYSQCHRVFLQLLGHSPREFMLPSVRLELAQRFEPHPGHCDTL
jgi:AraC-like DNA-binding protein